MSDRRRPVRHFRRTATGLVEVNKDVVYGDPTSVRGGLSLTDPTQQLVGRLDVPPPPPEHTGAMLAEEPVVLDPDVFDIPPIWFLAHRNHIDPVTGEGKLRVRLIHGTDPDRNHEDVIKIGPDMKSMRWNANLDLRRTNIPGATFGGSVINSTFAEANLDGSDFGVATSPFSRVRDVSFEGASLRSALFLYVAMQSVSLVGVDGTDARFRLTAPPENVDITDSNLHPSQFELDRTQDDMTGHLTYRRHTLGEAAHLIGVPLDEFAVVVWADGIEVRDNTTGKKIEGSFNADYHHIPQWEMQRLITEYATA